MNFEYFLEKDDFLCYSLLQQLIHQAEPIITTSQVLQQLQISSYQLNKIIKTLNDEFQKLSSHSQSKIETPDKNLIRGTNLSTTLLQQVSLEYLKRSSIFTVFQYQFIYSNMISKTDYMKQHFLSKTNFYSNETRLKEILRKSHFTQNTLMIADPEYAIRLHLFQFFYTTFNGVESPFPELNEITNQAVDELADSFHFNNSPTQVAKLSIFLKIWLLRIRNQGLIKQPFAKSLARTTPFQQLSVISPVFERLQISPNQVELEYLYMFLVTQNYIVAPDGFFISAEMPVPYQLTDQLMAMLSSSSMFTNPTAVDLSILRQAILAIHVRLVTFYVEPTTFISMDQISFFKETYPLFDDLIKKFINLLFKSRQLTLNTSDRINLYFSYMFAFINHIPTESLKDQVHICVDFSQGTLYTQYVVSTLATFSNAHIIIEQKLSSDTDIYLSDIYSQTVNQPQIIWQNPPTPTDWSVLGDIIVKTKKEKAGNLTSD